ncbi:uncharacterized protein LOC128883023 isoform X2 [Hylaeus volcanicus]|uniref:uncharacterized protein LOC128883023 isoform X2 n=1 Tax=Hylaeus volcanicus TaxID=313075 RepID=UPI0023B86B5E|nr:uncharacterized protein LOC128883023 isoform X2 [Hylaeus volcanicus]
MKFGKSIRKEARNNGGLAFINFKRLKRILKFWTIAANTGQWEIARKEDEIFQIFLKCELQRVHESFEREMKEILSILVLIQKNLPILKVETNSPFLLKLLRKKCHQPLMSCDKLCNIHQQINENLSSSQSDEVIALSNFCMNLEKISNCCKKLRRCVLWNAIAIVKIFKKRQKNVSCEIATRASFTPLDTAAAVLAKQEWYRSSELASVVSIVDTKTDTLMQKLTGKPPSRDQYECPICLDVILDPVSLRTCGHRFCWACLCMTYCEKSEGALELCPYCRAAFPLDPNAFVVDGILQRFLKTFFPKTQSSQLREHRETLRQKLRQLRHQQINEKDDHRTNSPAELSKKTKATAINSFRQETNDSIVLTNNSSFCKEVCTDELVNLEDKKIQEKGYTICCTPCDDNKDTTLCSVNVSSQLSSPVENKPSHCFKETSWIWSMETYRKEGTFCFSKQNKASVTLSLNTCESSTVPHLHENAMNDINSSDQMSHKSGFSSNQTQTITPKHPISDTSLSSSEINTKKLYSCNVFKHCEGNQEAIQQHANILDTINTHIDYLNQRNSLVVDQNIYDAETLTNQDPMNFCTLHWTVSSDTDSTDEITDFTFPQFPTLKDSYFYSFIEMNPQHLQHSTIILPRAYFSKTSAQNYDLTGSSHELDPSDTVTLPYYVYEAIDEDDDEFEEIYIQQNQFQYVTYKNSNPLIRCDRILCT